MKEDIWLGGKQGWEGRMERATRPSTASWCQMLQVRLEAYLSGHSYHTQSSSFRGHYRQLIKHNLKNLKCETKGLKLIVQERDSFSFKLMAFTPCPPLKPGLVGGCRRVESDQDLIVLNLEQSSVITFAMECSNQVNYVCQFLLINHS